MLEFNEIKPGIYVVKYFGRETVLNTYVCNKVCGDLDSEVQYRGIKPEYSISLIPETALTSPLQIIFATLAYIVYGYELRTRNKGLAYAMLVIGEGQITEAVEFLRRTYRESGKYYVIEFGGDSGLWNRESCSIDSVITFKELVDASIIEKNLETLMRRI